MPAAIRLDQALDGIYDAFVAALEAEIKTGGLLDGVTSVNRGDKSRTSPYPPCLWVWGSTMTPHSPGSTITHAEIWEIPITIVSVVKDDDPELAFAEANRLAAKARSAIKKTRGLGLAYVNDTRSGRFEPASPYYRDDKHQTSAAAEMIVRFVVME